MASLRKRPADAAVVTDGGEPVAEVSVETDAPPAPETPTNDATEALKLQIGALRQSETIKQQHAAMQAAEERRQHWLVSTPGARENVAALGAFHHAALNAGLVDTSPEYFSFMQSQLANLQQPATAATHMADEMQARFARAPEPPPRPSRVAYSAPVSRDIPSSNGKRSPGKVTLSAQEVEAARISGISPEEYAKQKIRKAQMVATGEYGEQQR
jgi:hypothetical protein